MKINWYKGLLQLVMVAMFSCAFLWRCANVMAPQGGPRDSLPPVVMGAVPEINSVNFSGKRIYITFDEYVKLQDQQKEFFVSPIMEAKPTLTIRGRGVQIDINDTLKDNTTYSFNFGNSIRDNNEGNPLSGFRYVMSTGATIDSMFMAGITLDAQKGDSVSGTLLFFYPAEVDSIPAYDSTLLKSVPAALAKAENNGIFVAQNLKPIDYRVYAVKDNNGNFTYDPETDNVAFLDSIVNPLRLPGFEVRYDTTRNYFVADPQLLFNMFTDTRFKQQRLAGSERPEQHKLTLEFSAPEPEILKLQFEGIDSLDIVTEYPTVGRDTLHMWLNVPSAELPDTIKGEMIYMKHDSLSVLVPDTVALSYAWRYVESKAEKKKREEEERKREKALKDSVEYVAPVEPNPYKFSLAADKVTTLDGVAMEFPRPLVKLDSLAMSLIREDGEAQYRVKFSLDQDTVDMRKWYLNAPWQSGQNYSLTIDSAAVVDVAGEYNDSLSKKFTVLDPEKFGSLKLNVTGESPESRYVIYLQNDGGQTLDELRHVGTGEYTFNYIPAGDVMLRILQDKNDSGMWDSGNLIERRQPERTDMYHDASGESVIIMKVNWEVDLNLDMATIFAPVTTESVRSKLRKQEAIRLKKIREEMIKKQEEMLKQQQKGGGSSSGSSGFGIGSGISSMKGSVSSFTK